MARSRTVSSAACCLADSGGWVAIVAVWVKLQFGDEPGIEPGVYPPYTALSRRGTILIKVQDDKQRRRKEILPGGGIDQMSDPNEGEALRRGI